MTTRSLLTAALSLAAALSLGACATDPSVTHAMLEAHMRQQAVPTLTLKCPAGCEFSYVDPRDRKEFRAPTNGWDAMISIGGAAANIVQTAVVPVAMGYVAVKGMKEIAGARGTTTTTTTTTTDNSNRSTGPVTTTTDSSNRSTGPVTTTTSTDSSNRSTTSTDSSNRSTTSTTNTTTSTVGANSGANSGNSGTIAGRDTNTGTPTVVTQPPPVVVTGP